MAKITTDIKFDLHTKEAIDKVKEATRLGIRDTVVSIHLDAGWNAKAVGAWLTGHNTRSMASEVSGMPGTTSRGEDAKPQRVVDDSKLQGAVYSTSGYGGFIETGTHNKDGSWRMAPRPYIQPAIDKNLGNLPGNIKKHLA